MRLCFALLASLSLVACGGDDSEEDDDGTDVDARRVDARETIDGGSTSDCLLATTYDVGLYANDNGDPVDFTGDGPFGADDDGNFVIAVYGSLNTLDGTEQYGNHGLLIYLVNNVGYFADNPFGNGATAAGTVNEIEDGDNCGACVEGYGGMDSENPPASDNLPTQIFLADSGTFEVTQFDEVVDDGETATTISANFTDVALTGYDYESGTALDGCSSTVSLGFAFTMTFDSTAFAPFGKTIQPRRSPVPFTLVRK